METEAQEQKVIFEWEVPADYQTTPHEDIAEVYRVVADPDAMSGIAILARYRGEWMVNPWNTRPLIKRLLQVNEGQ